jgi:hypothetical protein
VGKEITLYENIGRTVNMLEEMADNGGGLLLGHEVDDRLATKGWERFKHTSPLTQIL